MSEQNLVLNVLPFSHSVTTKIFSFYKEKRDKHYCLSKQEFPLNIDEIISKEELDKLDGLYTNFQSDEKALSIEVDMLKSKRFSKHYYNWVINNFFQDKADINSSNFIYDNELWFSNKAESKHLYYAYNVFTIKIQLGKITGQPELILSYDGVSRVHTKSLKELDYDTTLYKWVVYKKKLYRYKDIPEVAKYNDFEEVFPVINYRLSVVMGLQVEPKYTANKYRPYYKNINWFYSTYINTEEFKKIIPVDNKGFFQVDPLKVKNTTLGSNLLLFGQDKTHVAPYYGIKENGPHLLSPFPHIKFIFIFHEADRESATEIFQWFVGKKAKFDGGLKEFLKINFTFDKNNNVIFKNLENPIEEISEQLSQKSFDADVKYIAIYITPFSKSEMDPLKRKVYFQVKQELLKYGITSQVIDKTKIYENNFILNVSNIAIAILAKLGGVPWRLKRNLANELIVGVGAFKNLDLDEKYIGSAFCFSNDGHFKEFESYSASDTFMLAASIINAVKKYRKEHEKVERLIIHFYKTMSRRELEPIEKELKELELDIPVIIVTINKTESKDVVIFDTNHDQLIPISGTFINIGKNEFLLCNNTRYQKGEYKIEGYPFPIKIKINSKQFNLIKDYSVIKDLIDQVYQFSRMYWKGVKQQNLPVTIKYPEMIAEMLPYFENKTIPDFGKNNLWFL